MGWLFFALLAPIFATLGRFADKYTVSGVVRAPKAMPVYAGLVALVYGTLFWFATGTPLLSLDATLLIMAQGALMAPAGWFYFQAIADERASNIIFLRQTEPILVLGLSFIFLDETIGGDQLLGFVLIVLAALAVSLSRSEQSGRLEVSPALAFMLVANFIMASTSVLADFLLDNHAFEDVISYQSWGLALGAFVLYLLVPPMRHAFNQSARSVPRRAFGVVFFTESLFTVARLLFFFALSLGGPVALVSVLGSSQVFLGLVVGWALTRLSPAIFNEELRWSRLAQKGVFAAVMVVGVVMLG